MHPDQHSAPAFSSAHFGDRLVFGALLALIVVLPWPWGSNTDLAKSILGLAAGLLLVASALLILLGGLRRPRLTPTAVCSLVLWLTWLAWLALQLLPLPPADLQALSPRAFDYHQRVEPLHANPLYTLSIAPGATFNGLLDSLALFSLYSVALLTCYSRKRIRIVLGTIMLTGALQALYGMHMTLTGIEYGFLEKKTWGIGVATGTFVNRNHFAAYLELAASAGIGLVLADLGRWRTGSWRNWLRGLLDLLLSAKFRTRVILVAIVVGIVLTRSRLGNIAFFSALALVGMVFTMLRMRRWFLQALLIFLSLFLIDLWIVSGWFGLDKVVERIEQTDIETEQRPMVLEDLVPAALAYARTGAGFGTFAEAYSPFRSAEIQGNYDHAHNEYAELFVETGMIGFGTLALLVSVHLLHALRIMWRRKRNLYAGAAFAVLMSSSAMLIHATGEFMLRIPAVAATWVVLLAVCAGISSSSDARRQPDSVKSLTAQA